VGEVGYSVEPNGCWLWLGSTNNYGYARLGNLYIHVEMYERKYGPVPIGFELDHLCRTPPCVNPDHVEPATHGENIRRGDHPNTHKTVCPAGHVYTESNTKIVMMRNPHPGSILSPRRRCRRCLSDQRRRRYLAHGC
jgi:hypothetical protein